MFAHFLTSKLGKVHCEEQYILKNTAQNHQQNIIADEVIPYKSVKDTYSFCGLLGYGSFSDVCLAHCKGETSNNGEGTTLYALKFMTKSDLAERRTISQIIHERGVLEALNHPSIVKMEKSLQSDSFLVLVMEFCPGTNFKKYLLKHGRFTVEESRFLITELAHALRYVHSKNIIYRDLKPSNIIIGRTGHIKIYDFGFARGNVKSWLKGATTFLGTPNYMAPEILVMEEYGLSCDWWSLGCVFYHFLFGEAPYPGRTMEGVFRLIRTEPLKLLAEWPNEVKSFLRQILYKIPEQRLGQEGGGDEILRHPLFDEGCRSDRVEIGANPLQAVESPLYRNKIQKEEENARTSYAASIMNHSQVQSGDKAPRRTSFCLLDEVVEAADGADITNFIHRRMDGKFCVAATSPLKALAGSELFERASDGASMLADLSVRTGQGVNPNLVLISPSPMVGHGQRGRSNPTTSSYQSHNFGSIRNTCTFSSSLPSRDSDIENMMTADIFTTANVAALKKAPSKYRNCQEVLREWSNDEEVVEECVRLGEARAAKT